MLEILINGTPMGLCKADGDITQGRFVYKSDAFEVAQPTDGTEAALAIGPCKKYIVRPDVDDADAETIDDGERLIYMINGGVYKTDQVVPAADGWDFGAPLCVADDGRLRLWVDQSDDENLKIAEVEEYVGDDTAGVLTYQLYSK